MAAITNDPAYFIEFKNLGYDLDFVQFHDFLADARQS